MKSDKSINVGIIGFGTVGSGVADLFSVNLPSQINLKKIAVKNISKERKTRFSNLTGNPMELIEDPEINIIVELIGGYKPAKDYILKAIEKGKHVVTANKAVISEFGPEIFKAAEEYKVNIGFEGSVAGGIQIINPLVEQFSCGKIENISGILNGTTNFILTRMSEGMSYEDALIIAQEKGFAEADPSFDVDGLDAAQKISILASLAFGRWIRPNEVYTEGITQISPVDIEYAKELGYVIKLIATARKTNREEIDIRVHPALINANNRLAKVNEEFNAIQILGNPFDEYFNVGKGAGKGPTAFSVYNDIVKLAEMIRSKTLRKIKFENENIRIADQNDVKTEGYLRIYLRHVPGSFHSVIGILAEHGWNLKDSIQRSGKGFEIDYNGVKCLPDIITHEPLPFKTIRETLADLEKLQIGKGSPVYGKPYYMRIRQDF